MYSSVKAATLMEHLPPVGWADVATKSDLDQAFRQLDIKIEAVRSELLATIHKELNAQTRYIVPIVLGAMVTLSVTIGGLAFAAARLV